MSAKKQPEIKRACVDCHFLSIGLIKTDSEIVDGGCFNPYFISGDRFETYLSVREQIKRNEEITPDDYPFHFNYDIDGTDFRLACYEQCWNEVIPNAYEKRYTTVVKTDHSNCSYFYEYKPSMSFKTAQELREKMKLLKLSQNNSEGNRADVLKAVTPDNDIVDKKIIVIDCADKLLRYNTKEEKLEPLQIQLLQILYKNKNELVTKNMILDEIWKGVSIYEKQITDHMSKIRAAFRKLGFEKKVVNKEVIVTIRQSRVTDGGYKFCSNIVTLDFR
jgi:DNA-binding winged helix-turn-helix (wHTH) protein